MTNAPAQPVQGVEAGAVKPLVWNEYEAEGQIDQWDAETAMGSFYGITIEFDGYAVSHDCVHTAQRFDTPDEAKAAAQADYEARIRSALIASPAPAPEAPAGLIGVRTVTGADHSVSLFFDTLDHSERFLDELRAALATQADDTKGEA